MNKDYELTPPIPPTVERIAANLKLAGNLSFWTQLVFGGISTFALLLALPSFFQENRASQGTGFGAFFAFCGLVALGVSTYFAYRYRNIAKLLLTSSAVERPKKADTIQVIRFGLTVNMTGMLLSIVGTQSVVGNVLLKSLEQSPGLGATGASARFVLPVDMFSIQTNTTEVTAHFVGIVISLFLLNRITK